MPVFRLMRAASSSGLAGEKEWRPKISCISRSQAVARSSQHRAVMSSLWSLLLAF